MTKYASLALLAIAASLIAGCGIGSPTSPIAATGAAISGTVHGGQQPVYGARVYLLAAGASGYGAASTSVLTTNLAGTDSVGGYVLSGVGGNFSITGDYLCTPGQQLYLLALGGDPTGATTGLINNTAIGLMAALGTCPSSQSLAQALPSVSVNELTTVATAYALAGFATDAAHISSSGTTQAVHGVTNAFATAASLVSLVSGAALSTTTTGGTVPASEINTLGNILASCINTPTNLSSNCTSLFSYARAGGTTGTIPSETATAIINIAHHPGTNVSSLYGMSQGVGAPFGPTVSPAPNDFTIGIVYPFSSAQLAFDAFGNLWTVSAGPVEYSNAGALLSPAAGFTGGGITSNSFPYGLAIDPSNSIWLVQSGSSSLSEFSNSGVPLSPSAGYTGGGLSLPGSIAIDGAGNVWAGNSNASVSKFNNAGTPASPTAFSTSGEPRTAYVTIDGLGDVWTTSYTDYVSGVGSTFALTELNNSGAFLRAPSPGSSAEFIASTIDSSNDLLGALFAPGGTKIFKIAPNGTEVGNYPITGNTAVQQCLQTQVDGDGNLWCTSNGDFLAEVSSAGVSLSPDAGYMVPNVNGSEYLAIDSSGNIWTSGNYSIVNGHYLPLTVEVVGAAAPVVTPESLALQLGKAGARP